VQPCQVCGTADVDVNGYCVNCRTFRGMVYEVVTPSQGYAPAPPPTSVPPASPVAPAPPVKRRRNAPLSLLIFTTAALLVVSTILIVTVVMNDLGSASKASPAQSPSAKASSPSASPSASAAPAVLSGLDKCVIGNWTTTSELVPLDEKTTLKTTAGPTLEFRGDGTMTWSYGSGVTYSGTVGKKKAELLVTGQVTFKYSTVGRTINFNSAEPDARNVYTLDGVVQANGKFPVADQQASYACDGDTLTISQDTPYPLTARHQ
jgi:hypothetical protein